MSTAIGLPDLLRRFVATPYRFGAILYSKTVTFETNDRELLIGFRARAEELAGVLVSSSGKPWYWKVVRDYDISNEGDDALLLSSKELTTLSLGMGTVVAFDWNSGELLGFVAANISTEYLLDALLDVARGRCPNDKGTSA